MTMTPCFRMTDYSTIYLIYLIVNFRIFAWLKKVNYKLALTCINKIITDYLSANAFIKYAISISILSISIIKS